MPDTNNLGFRIRASREKIRLSQAELARRMDISKQAVHQWERGTSTPNPARLVQMAEILNTTVNFLLTGTNEEQHTNTSLAPGLKIPVIDYNQAASYNREKHKYMPHLSIRPVFDVSSKAFALSIVDNSMNPDFQEGDIVIIDPEIKPLPGDKVCAIIDGKENAIFRVFVSQGSDVKNFRLEALNPNWSYIEIDGNGAIIGVMSEHTRPRRP